MHRMMLVHYQEYLCVRPIKCSAFSPAAPLVRYQVGQYIQELMSLDPWEAMRSCVSEDNEIYWLLGVNAKCVGQQDMLKVVRFPAKYQLYQAL